MATCRTLEENLEDVIEHYRTNIEVHGDSHEKAKQQAVAGVVFDAETPCAELGRTLCAACQEKQERPTCRHCGAPAHRYCPVLAGPA